MWVVDVATKKKTWLGAVPNDDWRRFYEADFDYPGQPITVMERFPKLLFIRSLWQPTQYC